MDQLDAHLAFGNSYAVLDAHPDTFSDRDSNPDVDDDFDSNVHGYFDLVSDTDAHSNPDGHLHPYPVGIPYLDQNSDKDSNPDLHPNSKPYGAFRNGDCDPWKHLERDRYGNRDAALLLAHADGDTRCPDGYQPARLRAHRQHGL